MKFLKEYLNCKSDEVNHIYYQLTILFVAGLLLRITYFLLAYQNYGGLEEYFNTCPDSFGYLYISNEIFGSHPRGPDALFKIGPGFGFIIANLNLVFGEGRFVIYVFNMIISSLGAVVVYLLSYQLFKNKMISFVSGLICTLSLTSIALSSNYLSDPSFFTFHALSVLFLVSGIRKNDVKSFVVSGIFSGISLFIRSISRFWFLILLAIGFLIPVDKIYTNRKQLLKKLLIPICISLICLLSWSLRNYVKHDVFVFGSNGVNAARTYLGAKILSDISNNDKTVIDMRNELSKKEFEYFEGHKKTFAAQYSFTKKQVFEIFTTYPVQTLKTFFSLVYENMTAGNYMIKSQIPILNPVWWYLIDTNRNWLGVTIILLSLCSIVLLFVERKILAALILGSHYIYFSLITGFSFWQGSRLHYQAEIASSILISYFVITIILHSRSSIKTQYKKFLQFKSSL